MTVYAPYIATYSSRTPYITAAEFMASPTGVNVSQLVPRGTEDQNRTALNQAIARASSFIDQFCKQSLIATVNTQSGRYRVQRTGQMRIPLNLTPVIAVESIQTGFSPSNLQVMSDMSNVWIDRKTVSFPLQTIQMQGNYTPLFSDGRMFCIVKYVSGWASTTNTAAITAGDTTVTVDSTIGIQPGVQLTLYDTSATEQREVASVGANTVTFTEPFIFAHEAGYSLSALPEAVKQAAVLLTAAMIKTRGSEAIVMQQLRAQPSQTVPMEGGGFEEIAIAKELLLPFVRTM